MTKINKTRRTTPAWIEEWKKLRTEGWSYPAIARKYGVDHTTIIYHLGKLIKRKPGNKIDSISHPKISHNWGNIKSSQGNRTEEVYKKMVKESGRKIFVRDRIGNLVEVIEK